MPMPEGSETLTEDQKEQFRRLWAAGVPKSEIARYFKRSPTAIGNWSQRLGCTPRNIPKSGKLARFDISEAEIYAEAEAIRAKWPAWRTPQYAVLSGRSQARLQRIAAAVRAQEKETQSDE